MIFQDQNIFFFQLQNLLTGEVIDATNDLVNWTNFPLQFVRQDSHGVFDELELPSKFTGDTATFLVAAYDQGATDAQVKMSVFLRLNNEYEQYPKDFFADFSGFEKENLQSNFMRFENPETAFEFVNLPFTPFGITQKLFDRKEFGVSTEKELSYENVQIPLKTRRNVTLKNKIIRETNSFFVSPDFYSESFVYAPLATALRVPVQAFDFDIDFEELQDFIDTSTSASEGFVRQDITQDVDVSYDVSFDFDYDLNIDYDPAGFTCDSFELEVVVLSDITTVLQTGFSDGVVSPGAPFSLQGTATGTITNVESLVNGDARIFSVTYSTQVSAAGAFDAYTITGNFSLRCLKVKVFRDTSVGDSERELLLVHEVFSHVTEIITDTPNVFFSPVLGRIDSEPISYPQDGKGGLLSVATGLEVRGVTDQITGACSQSNSFGKPVILDFKTLFSDLDAIYCLGFDVEDEKVRVLERENFYQDATFATFSNVKGIKVIYSDDLVYNRVNGGYERYLTKDVFNSLDESCTEREYTTRVANVRNLLISGNRKREYNAQVKKLVASSWMREFQRRLPKDTKGGDYDEEILIECLLRDDDNFVTELDENFTSVTGVIDPTTLPNLRITPRRNIDRHLAFLNHIFWKRAYFWSVSNFTGNVDLTTVSNDSSFVNVGNPSSESGDIPYDLVSYIYDPERIIFEVPLDIEFILNFMQKGTDGVPNRYKKIRVTNLEENEGRFYTGWIDSLVCDFNPKKGWVMTFELIAIKSGVMPPNYPISE